jgi:hypothetical protein
MVNSSYGKFTIVLKPMRRVLVLSIAIMLCVIREAAAAYEASSTDWDGLSELVQLAKDEAGAGNVVANEPLDYTTLTPQDAVILLHPETTLDLDSLSRFLREGGRVVLFDDFGTGDELLRHFQIERVPLPAHPALELRHNSALAIAEPAEHQTVQNVSRVVLNHATGVEHRELSPLLFVRSMEGDKTYVGLAGAVEKGHLLVVSDASVPMNAMLRFPGNKTFTRNVIHYAFAGVGDVPSRGKIHIVSGAFEQLGTYGNGEGDYGKLHVLAEAFRSFKRDGLPSPAAYALAVVVALGLATWVWSRASRIHRATVPRYVRETPLAAQGGIAGHAALIASKPTTRALAVLEIKSALEEQLCAVLDLDRAPSPDEAVRRAKGQNLLSDESGRTLKALLAYMGEVETLVLSRRADAMRRVRDADVLRCARQAHDIAAELRSRHAQ